MPTINITNIDETALTRIRSARNARGWTYAKYIEQLVLLHSVGSGCDARHTHTRRQQ